MTQPRNDYAVLCEDLFKIYKQAELEVVALRGLDFSVQRGELVAVVGPSGSGKSTLMNILAGLDRPSAGKVTVEGRDLLTISPGELEHYRRLEVGFVWQAVGRNLAPYLTAMDNVELPMFLSGKEAWERHQRAQELLEAVGLGSRLHFYPRQLSAGEQQRVAIAVAMSNNPRLLLADEPTGELDSRTAIQVLQMFGTMTRSFGVTTIIVTHYPGIADLAIRDGKVSTETVKAVTFQPLAPGKKAAQEEYVVMDRAGRLQIPQQYVDRLHLGDRVKVTLEGDHLEVTPSESEQ